MLMLQRKLRSSLERCPVKWLIATAAFVILLTTYFLKMPSTVISEQLLKSIDGFGLTTTTATTTTTTTRSPQTTSTTTTSTTTTTTMATSISKTSTSNKKCNEWFAEHFSENLKVISNYPRGNADLYFQHINGNLTQPKIMMTSFPVILSAADETYYHILQGLLKSVHERLLPKYKDLKMIVYDLGFSKEQLQKMNALCRCEVRAFPYHLFPDYVRRLKSYAWKPLMVHTVLMEFGWVWWMDSSIRILTDNLGEALQYSKDNSVLFTNHGIANNIAYHTDPATMKFLGEDPCKFRYYGEVDANIDLYYYNNVTRIIVSQWAACALNKECMVPDGSEDKIHCDFTKLFDGRCHRYDQAVLSILLRRLFHEDGSYPRMNKPFRITDIRRGEKVNYF